MPNNAKRYTTTQIRGFFIGSLLLQPTLVHSEIAVNNLPEEGSSPA
jgi:hypothetical protein